MKRLLLFLTLALAILPAQAQRYMQAVSKFADLVNPALVGPQTNLWLNGYYGTNDGGGGAWTIVPDDGTATNAGTVVKVTTGWLAKRNYSPPISVKWFGARGDGSSDDTAAVNAAIKEAGSVGNRVYLPKTVPWGSYLFNLTIAGQVSLEGDLPNAAGVGGVTVSAFNTNNPCIQIGDGVTRATDVTLRNLNFNSYPITAKKALYVHGASRIRVADCTFNWWDGYCAKVDGTAAAPTTFIYFDRCFFAPASGGTGDGLQLIEGGNGFETTVYLTGCEFYDGGSSGHSFVNDSVWCYSRDSWWQINDGHGILLTNSWGVPHFTGQGTIEANAGTWGVGVENTFNDGGVLNVFDGSWKFYCSVKNAGGSIIDLSSWGEDVLGDQTILDDLYARRWIAFSSGVSSNNFLANTNNAIFADSSGNLNLYSTNTVIATAGTNAAFIVRDNQHAGTNLFAVNQSGSVTPYGTLMTFRDRNGGEPYIQVDGDGVSSWVLINPVGSIFEEPGVSKSWNVYNSAWGTQTPLSVSDSLVTVRSPQVNQSTISLTGAGTSALDLKSADGVNWFTFQAPPAMSGNFNWVLPGTNVTGVLYATVSGTNVYPAFFAQLPVGTLAPTNPVASMILGYDGTERIWEKVGVGLTNSGNTQLNVNMTAGTGISLTTNADNSLTVANTGSSSGNYLPTFFTSAGAPNVRRWSIVPNGNSLSALGNGISVNNSGTAYVNASATAPHGLRCSVTATGGNIDLGEVGAATVWNQWAGTNYWRIAPYDGSTYAMASNMFWGGFWSSNPATDTPTATGYGFRLSVTSAGDTHYIFYANDGTVSNSWSSGVSPVNGTPHCFSIEQSIPTGTVATNLVFKADGVAVVSNVKYNPTGAVVKHVLKALNDGGASANARGFILYYAEGSWLTN